MTVPESFKPLNKPAVTVPVSFESFGTPFTPVNVSEIVDVWFVFQVQVPLPLVGLVLPEVARVAELPGLGELRRERRRRRLDATADTTADLGALRGNSGENQFRVAELR